MNVWLVVDENRHTDIDVFPYSNEDDALAKAWDLVPDAADEIELTERMREDGWVLCLEYGTESDRVRVLLRVMDHHA